MSRLRTCLAVFAAAIALVALPTGATAVSNSPAAPTSATGCAVLQNYGSGWADIRNQCGSGINATVSLDWSWDPGCIYIPAGGTGRVHWDHSTLPDYAYDC